MLDIRKQMQTRDIDIVGLHLAGCWGKTPKV